MIQVMQQPSRAKLVLAFAAIYLIWGSTYLAIRYSIETMPGFLMAGTRFIIAGSILYGWARLRGAAKPTRSHWNTAWIIGAFLLLGGNGLVVWAEHRIDSGLAALLIAIEPLCIVILSWLRPGGLRPNRNVFIGLSIGFAGIALLVGPSAITGAHQVNLIGAMAVIFAAFSWATGSLYAQRAQVAPSPLLAAGMQMLTGGVLLLMAGLLTGQLSHFEPNRISMISLLSFSYLIVFGSIVAFTAYSWLLKVVSPAKVSTYAYVNPVVAVFLGWLLAGEIITVRTSVASAIIIAAVFLITSQEKSK
jgi:drug/metabolite transporter (DMT)-like permease